ncbi:MAG: tetratricopeptide repeat protein, partial [Flavobacteriaceae bacterium]
MKNIIFFILISLFFVSQVSAQEKTTDTQSLFNKALSFHYANKDSAYFYYEKTIAKANKENNITTLLNSYYYLTNVNGNYYDLKNYHKNIKRQEKLLFTDKRLDTFSFLNDYKKLLLFDKGNYNYKIKQYESSKTHFKNLLEKLNKEKFNKTNIETLQSVYSFLGAIYKNTGKFEVANSYYEKSIHLTEANKDSLTNWESKIHSFKKLQAKNFIAKKEFKKANKLLSEAFVFYSKNTKIPQFKNNFISTYVALAKNNIKQKHYHKAIQILNENTRFLKTDNPFDREIEILYGDAYLGLNFHTKADFYYKRSLEKTKQYRNNNKHQDVALIYAKLGELSFKQQEYEEALQNYQKALMQLENSFVNENFADNPNPEKVVSKTTLI